METEAPPTPALVRPDTAAVTVDALARHKRLPPEFLRKLGVHDRQRGGVGIPYYDFDRRPDVPGILATRVRTQLKAGKGSFWWPRGQGVHPYGLWRIDPYHGGGQLFVAEGESNVWSLWFHGRPALGLPGADTAQLTVHRDTLQNVDQLWVFQDPGKSGETFLRGVCSALGFCSFRGGVSVLDCQGGAGVKDVSDLHCQAPEDFDYALWELCRAARPLPPSQWLGKGAFSAALCEVLEDASPYLANRILEAIAPGLGELLRRAKGGVS